MGKHVCLQVKSLCAGEAALFATERLFSRVAYRFPRVFGDEFGEKFGEKFSDSLNLVKNVVTILVMNLVNHHILCQIQ